MKILFITRKYPPAIGGMETVAFELFSHFKKNNNIKLVALGRSQIYLPLFIVYAFVKSIFEITFNRPVVLYIADGLLSPVGYILKSLFKIQVVGTVHGLDITFSNPLYQKVIPFCLNSYDKIICVSEATKAECIKRNINKNKIVVISNGISISKKLSSIQKAVIRNKIINDLGIKINNPFLIFTLGRLVKRKGHKWFIENVFPKLDNRSIYLIAGDGPEIQNIRDAVSKNKSNDRIKLLGRVSDAEKENYLNACDLMVMPNIKVDGDMEGFGVVALESSIHGLPTVVSNIEGLKDAINEYNGYLVDSKNSSEFVNKINSLIKSPNISIVGSNFAKYTKKNFSWISISQKYLFEFLL